MEFRGALVPSHDYATVRLVWGPSRFTQNTKPTALMRPLQSCDPCCRRAGKQVELCQEGKTSLAPGTEASKWPNGYHDTSWHLLWAYPVSSCLGLKKCHHTWIHCCVIGQALVTCATPAISLMFLWPITNRVSLHGSCVQATEAVAGTW
jgi:hypothetical protein